MPKKISLSVLDFALPVPRVGSIDIYSGFNNAQMTGIEMHQVIQERRSKQFPSYQSEVMITHSFAQPEYIFEVNGRLDGMYLDKKTKIEEIKTAFNVFELYRNLKDQTESHPYCLQLKTYGYIHWLQTKEIPELTLHLVSTRNEESIDLNLYLNIERYEKWLDARLEELVIEAKDAEKRIARRKQSGATLTFPFTTPRPGQLELIDSIQSGMQDNRPMLLQAPTGLGKTVGVLYPALQEALLRGQKVIYITPKNSQHSVAENAIEHLQATGAKIKSLTLTAKNKMCFKNEPLCNPEYCEFAQDHYTKVAEHKLPVKLAKKRNLSAETFKTMAEEYQVCPFELQFESVRNVDTVICDYNYVFAPRASTGRLSNLSIGETGKPNLIIDEIHNLPARAMDYYSPSLSIIAFEKMRDELENIPDPFRTKAESFINDCIAIVKRCGPVDCKQPCKIDAPVRSFTKHDEKLREFLSSYLHSDVVIEREDVIMRLAYYWSEFTAALEFVSLHRDEFFTTYNPHPPTVKITCCDASAMLKPYYEEYKQIIGFSATLKPFEFYSQLTGLLSNKLITAEFPSPFPTTNRKILIIPQISSKYSERQRNYPRIAETIYKIVSLKSGNYFAFFPSFEFMENVLDVFELPPAYAVLRQTKGMVKDDVNEVMRRLSTRQSQIVFAVQGGIFAEGVDYPGSMAIGAFVVGPPLPNFDLEREKMKEYYQKNYAAGFDYAYTYPAMAKAIQAAGRVIRSETDKGIIVLMDNRFIQSNYAKCMPNDWFEDQPYELVSQAILKELTDFWQK